MGEEKDRGIKIDVDNLNKLLNGIHQIEAGFHMAIHALADSKNRHTQGFGKLCLGREDIEALKQALNPTVFL